MNNRKFRNSEFLSRQIILSFLTALGVTCFFLLIQSILVEQQLFQQSIITGIEITIIPGIVILINSYIQQEINKEKSKLLEENRKSFNNQQERNNSASSLVEMATNSLKTIVADHPELSTLEKESFTSLVNELETLQSAKSSQMTRVWLNDKENLQSIAKKAGNMALKANPYKVFMIFRDKNKSKELLYYSIYYCLQWIERSFDVGDYLNTTNLPKISDKERTISALKIIKTEILTEELQEELGIYFDEIINLIPSL